MGSAERSEAADCEADLVRHAQAGDRSAFDHLARRYRPLLTALAFMRTGSGESAEDLVQEILLRAWQRLSALHDPGLFLPWVRTIAANACISWRRGQRPQPAALEDATSLPADEACPLHCLLQREAERQWQRVLATLPEANRLAFLMHVWGDAPYEEIAAQTGVPVTTVEGRIYRARRQLRRLLRDEPLLLVDLPIRPADMPVRVPAPSTPQEVPMTAIPATTHPVDWSQPRALAAFTHRLSVMTDVGVPQLRALETLREAPEPFGAAAESIEEAVRKGASLSAALAQRPDLFSAPYLVMIRAGEAGGILEETLQRLSRMMAREWQLAARRPESEPPLFFLRPAGQAPVGKWTDLSPYQQAATLLLFCETFGMLLQSGVPIVQAMQLVADLLPAGCRDGWMKVREEVLDAQPLSPGMERMGIFPRFALEMIEVGLKSGTLDGVLYRLAETFEDDLEYASA